MIIGNNKDLVIENIKKRVEEKEFNAKVEVDDPKLSANERNKLINDYLKNRETMSYKAKNMIAKGIINCVSWSQNRETEILGLENIQDIDNGAIITSNHFNPLDNLVVKKLVSNVKGKHLYIVGQDTNLAMTGIVGFIMNYSDIILISSDVDYMKSDFQDIMKETLDKGEFVLIYPEQEMWFNYRKPRPLKLGAYHYAAKFGVPIISCFVEIIDKDEMDNDEFSKLKYVMHVLKPIYPDKNKTAKENSKIMMNIDYNQKKEAYEKAYNKKLDYKFENQDIAGWRK